MVRSSARAKPLVGSSESGAPWPAPGVYLPQSCSPNPIFKNRSPVMFTVIGSSVMIGPGFVVVVVETLAPWAAALPPPNTNPFRPPRIPTAARATMASVLPLPPLASSPSLFFFAISVVSIQFVGVVDPGGDLADGRVGAGG